jgi:phosphate transport system ATP-binding protein
MSATPPTPGSPTRTEYERDDVCRYCGSPLTGVKCSNCGANSPATFVARLRQERQELAELSAMAPQHPAGVPANGKIKMRSVGVSAYYGSKKAIENISIDFPERSVSAIIGPSGCGKSTFIRCLNRMHEVTPRARIEGKVMLDGKDIMEDDAVHVRRRIGMVFQRANPFPTMSVYNNVAAGLRLNGVRDRALLDQRVLRSLKQAALWDEVKANIDAPGVSLSGGQQQRLCIARALAVEPEVLLMDEPCSALDPIATSKIEDLIFDLKKNYTVIIVTHNMQQAARVADFTAFLYLGKLIEFGPTKQIFENPKEKLTENYITGRFG